MNENIEYAILNFVNETETELNDLIGLFNFLKDKKSKESLKLFYNKLTELRIATGTVISDINKLD